MATATQEKPVKAQWEELAEWGTELEIDGAEGLVEGEPKASAAPGGHLPPVVFRAMA